MKNERRDIMTLRSESFSLYNSLPCGEVLGSGVHVFEVLYSQGMGVTKVWINAKSVHEAIDFFCKRYNLTKTSHSALGTNAKRYYRVGAVDRMTGRQPYEDALIRRMY